MPESDTMFNERDQRCAAVQRMLSTDPSYNITPHSPDDGSTEPKHYSVDFVSQ